MEKMKKIIMKGLFILTGNPVAQAILEKSFYLTRLLLGIGSGGFPMESGEGKVLALLKDHYRGQHKPITIFDVGANKGQFLGLILQKLDAEEIKVYCFEPSKQAYKSLDDKYGGNASIFVENLGLDTHAHESEIYYDHPGSLRASKFQRDLRHLGVVFNHSEVVRFATLDGYCEANNINEIGLLKIDVEGNELNVLKGAEKMLDNKSIQLITFEFGRAQIDSATFFKHVYYFLSGCGMKNLYRILPNGYLKPIKKYDEKNEMFFTTNYLAVMR